MLFTYNWFIIILALVVPAVLLCLLQWWLSKRNSPVPGLILPALHLILTILLLIAIATFSAVGMTTVTGYEIVEPGQMELLQEAAGDTEPSPLPVEATPAESSSIGIIGGADGPTAIFVTGPTDFLSMLPAFLILNIPTGVYLVIYAVTRRGLHRRKTVDKTTIQDL